MIDSLLDTSIIVDLIRKFPPATQWVSRQGNYGVTATVWLEILNGVQNKRSATLATTVLEGFPRIDPISEDYDRAISLSLRYRLSYGVQSDDCLIAAVALRLGLPVMTINIKHYSPMLGANAQKPY